MNIVSLKEIKIEHDNNLIGGKARSLVHLIQELSKMQIKVPNGFVITTKVYDEFIKYNNLDDNIKTLLYNIDVSDINRLKDIGIQIRKLITSAILPSEIEKQICDKYYELSRENNKDEIDVACRSSAIGEDGNINSFAGQLDTYLNVRGPQNVIKSVKKCFAFSIY